MIKEKFRIFNENNLRKLINEKVEEEFNKCKKEFEIMWKEVNNLRAEVRAISQDMRFVRSLPAYQDLRRFKAQ